MPEQALCIPHSWELADSPVLREEVYSFRYKHYFSHLPEAEWLDHGRGRVYAPHDEHSVHLVARNAEGKMIAIGTGTRADAGDLPEEWMHMLRLERLKPLGLSKIIIYSRLVELPECRGTPLFLHFFKYAAQLFTSQGFGYTIHYSPPATVAMYERLGYRVYSGGFTLTSGLYRIPMILVAADAVHLARAHPAFSDAIRELVPAGEPDLAYKLLPELRALPLVTHSAPQALAHVCSLYRINGMEQTIPKEVARFIWRATLLRLRREDAPIHASDKPFLWFILSGTCRVHGKDGGSLIAEAGDGINAYSGCSFVALEDVNVLVFANHAPFEGARSVTPGPVFWKKLLDGADGAGS
ncbi:MAG: hypothetical protein LBI88_02650 [Deltaproteobacteria bacterium]|nr:hypothetical protein [Deltaproteobacteria bacterium]